MTAAKAGEERDYRIYHQRVIEAEELIVSQNYDATLQVYEELFENYDYAFLRDYIIATQLAVHIKDFERAFKYLKFGVSDGWTLKEIKKNKFIRPLTSMKEWNRVEDDYEVLRSDYCKRIDEDLRDEVQKMYKKDQKFAFKYLFKIGQKAKERYGSEKGATHARQQIDQLNGIIATKGYPGVKLIGESQWMSTILSHHNSVSKEFVVNDSLYPSLRPKLLEAIVKGEMSPYDFAFIEDWKIAVKSNRQDTGYCFLDVPTKEEISKTNELRRNLNIRSIETRNGLVDIQEKTGMNFCLAGRPWVQGKIIPKD